MSRILSASAWHFRQHYITDADLRAMVDGILLLDAKVTRSGLRRDPDRPTIWSSSLVVCAWSVFRFYMTERA
jgi:hypothetical protein